MNDLLLDIRDLLKRDIKVQEGNKEYHIKDIKTYYDMEYSLRVAIKVFNKAENKDEVFILGIDNVSDIVEDEIKWFEELN